MTVAICLATHNGARHLPAQLDSLFAQTNQDWRLLVRDDGSTDGSADIVESYARRHPGRIDIRRNAENLGVVANFDRLLQDADADWILLCDQDDVWLPAKVEKTLAAAREAERRHGGAAPLLLHSDLTVVDGELNEVAPSLWRYQRCDPEAGRRLNRLLLQNAVTGCTVAINRALRDLAVPIPAGARMHDWWLALTAAAFGRIEYLAEPTVLYRQHGGNAAGAHHWGTGEAVKLLGQVAEVRRVLAANREQGALFLEHFRDRLPPAAATLLEAYASLGRQNFIARRLAIVRHGFSFQGALRNLGFLLVA